MVPEYWSHENEGDMVWWWNPDGETELVKLVDLDPETRGDLKQVTIRRGGLDGEKTVPLREVEKVYVSDVGTEDLEIREGDRVSWENHHIYERSDVEILDLPYDFQKSSDISSNPCPREKKWKDIERGRTYARIDDMPSFDGGMRAFCVPVSELKKQEATAEETQEEETQEEETQESGQEEAADEEEPKGENDKAEEKLDQRITVRVSRSEKREIERRAAAAGKSVSRFMAESSLSGEDVVGATEEELEEFRRIADKVGDLYQELRQVGGNVSQIAQRIRSRERITSEAIKRAAEAVEQASDDVYDVMNEIPQ
jgi:hypothetical protein